MTVIESLILVLAFVFLGGIIMRTWAKAFFPNVWKQESEKK